MKKKLSTVLLALAAFMPMTAQNLVKGDYGYLYCHMSDKGEWTAYAISRDGYNYQDINGGNPIFNPEEHARIEGGTRDAYITRMYNGKGYIMVTTDMCVRKSHKWDNYGIDLLKSDGLYHMLIKKEGGKPGIYTATSKYLNHGWGEPVENDYVSFEGRKNCEGSSAFQLIGDDTWRVAYIQYHDNPKHYRICKADKYLRNFSDPVDIKGVTGPQHGSFMRITKKEYNSLLKWDKELKSKKK